jgi:hypothetical protein
MKIPLLPLNLILLKKARFGFRGNGQARTAISGFSNRCIDQLCYVTVIPLSMLFSP